MKLSEVKRHLVQLKEINFLLPNGNFVPKHFHVTEVGLIDRNFIDCGGIQRKESTINFPLSQANEYEHRLDPKKMLTIIEMAEKALALKDLDVEVEYQGETIGRYGLTASMNDFLLTSKQTDCLALDSCGIAVKEKISLADLTQESNNSCTPGSGCC
jgi:hypothetical protein